MLITEIMDRYTRSKLYKGIKRFCGNIIQLTKNNNLFPKTSYCVYLVDIVLYSSQIKISV